jgi:hypothetical protein
MYKEVKEQFKSLHKVERETLFVDMLIDGDITYEDISKMYVAYKEQEAQKKGLLIADLAICNAAFFKTTKKNKPTIDTYPKKQRDGLTKKTAQAMLDSGIFKGTVYEKDLQAVIEKL